MVYIISVAFFLVSSLYAAVGHGGGSGYLATMSLLGIPPEMMKPTALSLNILVASIGTWKYARAGYFSGRLFWPIAAMSIPFRLYRRQTGVTNRHLSPGRRACPSICRFPPLAEHDAC